MKSPTPKNKSPHMRRNAVISMVVAVVLLIGGSLLYLEKTRTTDFIKDPFYKKSSLDVDQNTKNDSIENKTEGGTTSSKDNGGDTVPKLDSSVTPLSPEGTFVSNHRPNISGHPAPSSEASTCTTTVGADCQIRFTKGSVAVSLDKKTTDSNGNVVWYWDLEKTGLTEGEWIVSAVATNGSNSSTTTDPMSLNVSS